MDEQELEALEKSVVHAATAHARIAQPVQAFVVKLMVVQSQGRSMI